MATSGIFTDLYRERYATVARDGAPLDALKLAYFKIGCAGVGPGGAMPAVDAAYTDIQALGGAACPLPVSLPGGSELTSTGVNWYYCKAFAPGEVTVTGNVLTAVCRLDAGEANDDGTTTNPSLYELGLFDDADNMLCYVAFSEVIKTDEKSVERSVVISF